MPPKKHALQKNSPLFDRVRNALFRPRFVLLSAFFQLSLNAFAAEARRAEDFVNSIGVNTHFSLYHHYSEPATLAALQESGIRNLRGKAHFVSGREASEQWFFENTPAVRQLIVIDGTAAGSTMPAGLLPNMSPERLARVLGIEGLNEPDNHSYAWNGSFSNKDAGDLSGSRTHQWELYHNFKTSVDPAHRAIPVLSPAVAWSKNSGLLAPVRFDKVSVHPYMYGVHPGAGWLDSEKLSDAKQTVAPGQSSKSLWVTEAGYNNAVLSQAAHRPITEAAGGKYIPRLIASHFNRGIEKTFLYEFMDRGVSEYEVEDRFGLVRNDLSRSRKPAFWGVKNLIEILSDSGASASSFKTGSLNLVVTGTKTADIRSSLLQKSNGTYYLLIWQEVSSCNSWVWDTGNSRFSAPVDIPVPNVDVIVSLGGTASLVERITQLGTANLVTDTLPSGASINLSVPDEIVILRISGLTSSKRVSPPLLPGPDLVVSAITTEPAEPLPGQTVIVRATITNRGKTASTSASTVQFRLNNQNNDNALGTAVVPPVAPGQSVTGTCGQVWELGVTAAGTHTIRAICDVSKVVLESNEINNSTCRAVAVPFARFVESGNDFSSGGWTQATINPWILGSGGGNSFYVNTSTNSTATLTHLETLDSSWRLDFDYEWRWGGNNKDLEIRAEILDGEGKGYRIAVRQGDGGQSSETARQVRIFKVGASGGGVTLLGAGTGYNSRGCWTYADAEGKQPRWKRISLIFDRATKSLSAYIDSNGDGFLEQVVGPVSDYSEGIGSFSKVTFNASPLGGCGPMLDNIRLTKGMIDLVPGVFFQENFDATWPPAGWVVSSNWVQRSLGTSGKLKFAENTAGDSTGDMVKEFPEAVTGSWTLSFDYDWMYSGGTTGGNSYGFSAARVYGDLLDEGNNGYRIEVRQGKHGDSGDSCAGTVHIVRVEGGAAISSLADGEAYNMAGWIPQGLAEPRFKRIVFSYNAADQKLHVLADPNEDGLLEEVISAVHVPSITPFKKIRISAKHFWGGTCRPVIDNIQLGRVP